MMTDFEYHDTTTKKTELNNRSGNVWRGVPLSKLKYSSDVLFPSVVISSQHHILFELPVRAGVRLTPVSVGVSKATDNHVRLPHSPSSCFSSVQNEVKPRWPLIKQVLASEILSSYELEAAIFAYNSKNDQKWSFQALHQFFTKTLDSGESDYFFESVLPGIAALAISLETELPCPLPLLARHSSHSISLSQRQVAALLANAFFCTFPKRNSLNPSYPYINFTRLFQCGDLRVTQEKLKCLINYFRRVCFSGNEGGVVTYSRHWVSRPPDWAGSTLPLPQLHITSKGTIEDQGLGLMEIDFANKFVGGGVLGRGSVQEEIKFLICPELIVARLFTECLDDTEALIVTGCERFNTYEGYGETFKWSGDYVDRSPRDKYGRICSTVVAIDASYFSDPRTQFKHQLITRELNKAYAGFSFGKEEGWKRNIATGNWGCGAFRGDPHLKALIQLMAAGQSSRHLAYFTFSNDSLRDTIYNMYSFLVSNNVCIGELWKYLQSYEMSMDNFQLYEFLYKIVRNTKDSVGKASIDEKHIYSEKFRERNEEPMQYEENVTKSDDAVCGIMKSRNSVAEVSKESEFNRQERKELGGQEKDLIKKEESRLEVGSEKVKARGGEPLQAETYSLTTDEGLARCLQTDRLQWKAYSAASQMCTPSSRKLKRKISDYFSPVNDK